MKAVQPLALANRPRNGKAEPPAAANLGIVPRAAADEPSAAKTTVTPRNPLPRDRFALLFAVMLVAASGNTAMQSLMPAIGRELHIHDLWVAVAFSLSAVAW